MKSRLCLDNIETQNRPLECELTLRYNQESTV